MIRLSSLCCAAFLFLPLSAHAQRSQEAKIDFGVPVLDSSTQNEPDLTLGRQLMIDGTNAFRRENGKPPMRLNPELEAAAISFAQFMANNDKYGHTVDGHEPWERARLAGYDYCLVDENIAFAEVPAGTTAQQLVDTFVQLWEKSPEHRENLLDADVVDIGVAISRDEKTGKYYAVQDFGRPKSLAYRFTLRNDTDAEIQYLVDDKDFKLPPHYRMVHERCRQSAVALTIKGPDEKESIETLQPTNGQSFTIRQNDSGVPTVSKD